jgi:hypothetical protein
VSRTIRDFCYPKAQIASLPLYDAGLLFLRAKENHGSLCRIRLKPFSCTSLILPVLLFAQTDPHSNFGPPLKPVVKLIGYFNAPVPKENVLPVLTIKLLGDKKRHTFLLSELKVMAGPLRTSESILSAVKPYTTNFHLHASQEILAQIRSAAPTEQLTILAEYSGADRILHVQNIEKKLGLTKEGTQTSWGIDRS